MEVTLNVGKDFPQINGDNSDQFATEMLKLEDSDIDEVVLDFEGTEYINSMAMGTIFATFQKLEEQERNLKLINVNEKIKRLLKVANLADVFSVE
ncbi:MAG: STAS domain-containing protein [Planctomycetota bacterium]|jgi:anti-anti-sigma factor